MFRINIIEKIVTVIISLIVTIIISYFFYGYFLYPVQINSEFLETWNIKYNQTEYLNSIDFLNAGYSDMNQVDLRFINTGSCDSNGYIVGGINNPKISSFPEMDCKINSPTKEVGSNLLDVYCNRINQYGHLKISWESSHKFSQNCTYEFSYQLGIIPFRYYTNVIFIENNYTYCGDSICTKNEVGNCCRDCECSQNQFCYVDNLCYSKEFHIFNFSLVNTTLEVGEIANVTFGFQSNYPTNYSLIVFWQYGNSSYFPGWRNTSYFLGWGISYPWWSSCYLNVSGNWKVLLVANSTIGSDEKEINFTVLDNPLYPKT